MTDSEKELVRPSMTDALVEKVEAAISSAFMDGNIRFEAQRMLARAAILAVLDHFSEPGNVTDGMAKAFDKSWGIGWHLLSDEEKKNGPYPRGIAAAMRAARDEMRGGT